LLTPDDRATESMLNPLTPHSAIRAPAALSTFSWASELGVRAMTNRIGIQS
jgi:hypothetical protein